MGQNTNGSDAYAVCYKNLTMKALNALIKLIIDIAS